MAEHIYDLFVDWSGGDLRFDYTQNGKRILTQLPKEFAAARARELAEEIFEILRRYARSFPKEDLVRNQLQRLGDRLYSEVFPKEVARELQQAPGAEYDYLLLNLPRNLLWIPWELLYGGRAFLCEQFRVARHLHQTGKEHRACEKRMKAPRTGRGAFVAVGTKDDLKEATNELKNVKQALATLYPRYVQSRVNKNADDLLPILKQDHEVLHFIGHGTYEKGNAEKTGWQCGKHLLNCNMLEKDCTEAIYPRLIFANACDSARPSPDTSENYVSDLYLAFLRKGVPHYIGTLAKVDDERSSAFAGYFYKELSKGVTIGEALWRARRAFLNQPGSPIWAYYVHYGDPRQALASEDLPFEPTGPPPPVVRMRRWRRPVLAVLLGVAVLASAFVLWQQYFTGFPREVFGVAVAPLLVTDLTRPGTPRAESLLSAQELEAGIAEFLDREEFETKSFQTTFQSHSEARAWGVRKRAGVVIWGSAERGSTSIVLRLRGTRVALPEVGHQRETYKRFFLHMVFRDYFRDERSYATDFNLADLSVDLADPGGISVAHTHAELLATFIRGLTRYAQGEYQAAASLLEKVAALEEVHELSVLAQRWLVLAYLNGRDYEKALHTFSNLVDEDFLQEEDVVRLAFLKASYERYVLQVRLPRADLDWYEPLQQAAASDTLSPALKAVAAVLLARDQLGMTGIGQKLAFLPSQDEWPEFVDRLVSEIASVQPIIESAVSGSPDAYFLHYLLAMLTMKPAVAEEALLTAERVNPKAAEPHFGRARLLGMDLVWDEEGALEEIDKAIAKDPSEESYWFRKGVLLERLVDSSIGEPHRTVRRELTLFTEEFLRTPYASTKDRVRLLRRLSHDYHLLQRQAEAIDALRRAHRELPNDPALCQTLAIISMRELGALEEAKTFLLCAVRLSAWSAPTVEQLWSELRWRGGEFDEAIERYVRSPPVRGRSQEDARESVVVLDILGNILHTAGRYEDAEKVLRRAKKLALQTTPYPGETFPGGNSIFYLTIPEDDWKWRWATTHDLGLLLLSKGDYTGAAQEFGQAVQFLKTNLDERYPNPQIPPFTFEFTEMRLLTRMCEGYAHLKRKDYEAAARAWWGASHHTQYTFTGFASEAEIEEANQQDLTDLLRDIREAPYHVTRSMVDEIFERLVLLRRYNDATQFIETNALHVGDMKPMEWTSKLLFLYAVEQEFEKAELEFSAFARRYGAGSAFKDVQSGFNTSLYTGWFYAWPREYPSSHYFWDIISKNPRPDLSMSVVP